MRFNNFGQTSPMYKILYLFLLINLTGLNCHGTLASAKEEITWVGSTPGDRTIRTMLGIPLQDSVDFMKWKLVTNDRLFKLHIVYGLSKPNTQDFMKRHDLEFTGSCEKRNDRSSIYTLSGKKLLLRFIQLDDNTIHLLTGDGQLMNGNAGWSYGLSREKPVTKSGKQFITQGTGLDKNKTLGFRGRTPCSNEIKKVYAMEKPASCFKLKWSIDFFRDTVTGLPAIYKMIKVVDGARQDVYGKWEIVNENGNEMIRMKPDLSDKYYFLLIASGDVLYILDDNKEIIPGNSEFAFALNREEKPRN